MNIVCIGGGPAGLYFALLMKRQDPAHRITVVERNRPYDTFGWGVVFSDQTLGNMRAADAPTADAILDAFSHWDDIEIHFRGHAIRSGGHGFCGIGRKRLLNILQRRCEELGVELVFETDVASDAAYPDADLVIASDGLNSRIRALHAGTYQPDIDLRRNRFVWLGTHKLFEAFTFAFEETPHGWFQAHAYRFDDTTSTFIVETPESVWQAAGLDRMEKEASIAFCERLFARYLDGHPLMSNAAHLRGSAQWIRFPRVVCRRWVHHNGRAPVVLMGDAAHTAHFSIGSGTKLALEDAIDLVHSIGAHPGDLATALHAYEARRSIEVQRIQNAARNSTEWFENVARYAALPPEQFAYSLLTRSQRISHENLRLRDKSWLEGYEDWVAARAGVARSGDRQPIPPMFTPFTVRGVTLANRVVVSPMAQYSCAAGVPGDYHLVHLGARAMGGAGLVVAEMTCVSPQARITPGCPGLWNDAQRDAWKRIVDFVHADTPAKIAMQLGHAGAKGSTRVAWEGIDLPLDHGNWPLMSASPQQYLDGVSAWSRAMTRADMDEVRDQFVAAAQRAAEAGFDWLELHCAHGYLLSSFISPLTNQRTDEYGGPLAKPLALSARGLRGRARRMAVAPADVGTHLGARLGRRRHHARRRGGDRARLQGGRRRHDRLLVGTGEQARAAGLRTHVPDALRRSHPQRGGHRHHRRGGDLRGRSREQHRGGGTRRSLRRRPSAPRQRVVDAAGGRAHRLPRRRMAAAVPHGQAAARAQYRAREGAGRAGDRAVAARAGEPGAGGMSAPGRPKRELPRSASARRASR